MGDSVVECVFLSLSLTAVLHEKLGKQATRNANPRGTARKMLLENSSRTQAITDTRFQVSRRTYVTQEQHKNNISVLLEIDLW